MSSPINMDQLEAWLENQSPKVHFAIATRAALRTFPTILGQRSSTAVPESVSLMTARATICALSAFANRTSLEALEIRKYSNSVVYNLQQAEKTAGSDPHFASLSINRSRLSAAAAARFAAMTVSSTKRQSHTAVSSGSTSIASAFVSLKDPPDASVRAQTENAAFIDCIKIGSIEPKEIFFDGLWPEKSKLEKISKFALAPIKDIPQSGSPWSFWRNLYEGFLNGEPLDWELQKRVALIADNVWEEGVEAVAEKIEGIQRPFEIRGYVKELKSQLTQIEQPIAGLGHNHPPEAIETATPAQTTTIIWAELSKIEKLTEDIDPSTKDVRNIIAKVKELATRVGAFGKDVAYDNAKTMTTIVATSFVVTNWPRVQALLFQISQTIDEWLAYLVLGP